MNKVNQFDFDLINSYLDNRIYNTKKIKFYRNLGDKKPINIFHKKRLTKAFEFKVINFMQIKDKGYFEVIDLNQDSKTYKLNGYIYANFKSFQKAFYDKGPTSNRIKIINKNVNVYYYPNLKRFVQHYRKHKKLKVIDIIKTGNLFSFKINDNKYITANKRFVKIIK